MARPRIILEPRNTLVDQAVSISLQGFAPREQVVLRARANDDLGRTWESVGVYATDENGSTDLSLARPESGTFQGQDPMGLFWSMTLKSEKKTWFAKNTITPLSIVFTVEVHGETQAAETLERSFMASDIRTETLREDGLRGTLFLPEGPENSPGVLILGGYPGGGGEGPVGRAALLSSHGYAALCLPYFGSEGLPESPVNIPLEYFEKAFGWLLQHERVADGGFAVVGSSLGGELALLLGATFPQVRAVVACVPASIHTPGTDKSGAVVAAPTWTYQGKPLPYLRETPTPEERSAIGRGDLGSVRPALVSSLMESTIPVERIRGPVLLISALDDNPDWPSPLMSDMVIKRLATSNHPYARKHLSYLGAGHNIGVPYLPPAVGEILLPVNGQTVDYGGTVEATANASLDSWRSLLEFLHTQFRPLVSSRVASATLHPNLD